MKELMQRLALAQGEFPNIDLDSKGHNYKYASLPAILKTVRPILNKHGVFLTQWVGAGEDPSAITLTTELRHGDEVYSATMLAKVDDGRIKGVQAIGSTITYLRRYQICAMLGIAGDEDDDGVSVSHAKTQTKPAQQPQQPKATPENKPSADKPINDAQLKNIFAIITPLFGSGKDDATRMRRVGFLSHAIDRRIDSAKDMTSLEAANFITTFQSNDDLLGERYAEWLEAVETQPS